MQLADTDQWLVSLSHLCRFFAAGTPGAKVPGSKGTLAPGSEWDRERKRAVILPVNGTDK